MLNFYFKPTLTSKGILKKIAPFVWVLPFLFSIPLSGKNIDFDSEESPAQNPQSVLFISDDAFLYNKEAVSISENNLQVEKEQNTEIFIAEGASVYNAETFGNIKITKLTAKKEKAHANQTKEEKKELVVVAKNEFRQQKNSILHFHSQENSDTFSQSEVKNIVFSQSRTQLLSKALISFSSINIQCIFKKEILPVTYQNPTITVCHFSGKHSIRPPTYVS